MARKSMFVQNSASRWLAPARHLACAILHSRHAQLGSQLASRASATEAGERPTQATSGPIQASQPPATYRIAQAPAWSLHKLSLCGILITAASDVGGNSLRERLTFWSLGG